jgi:uncharacterized protein (DUF2249 family)
MSTTLQHDDTPATCMLDVRPILAAGDEPFSLIMRTVRALPAGSTLDLVAPFAPTPLYEVLGDAGWTYAVRDVADDGTHVVRFTDVGITADHTPQQLLAERPQLSAVFDRWGVDQCCGGAKPLSTIARAHGFALRPLLAELQQVALGG